MWLRVDQLHISQAKLRLRECDLVFTDLAMDIVSGLELIKWIRGEGYDLPIVATSGNVGSLPLAQEAGANVCIPKPWELDVLKRTFAELLG